MKRIDISQHVLTLSHTTIVKGITNALQDSYMKKEPFELVFDYDNVNYIHVGGISYDDLNHEYGLTFLDWRNATYLIFRVTDVDKVVVEPVEV